VELNDRRCARNAADQRPEQPESDRASSRQD